MRKSKTKIHWVTWPLLGLGVMGLALSMLWHDQALPSAIASPLGSPSVGTYPASTQPQIPSREPKQPAEQPVIPIPLGGRLADGSAELSGLAWYGDTLILLPQYPRRATGGNQGYLYALPKQDITDYLDGKLKGPLEPTPIPFDAYGLRDEMREFQGFESIGFSGNRVYLTIEAGSGSSMIGYLVSGKVEPDLSKIVLDSQEILPIEAQTTLDNKADEALLVLDDRILTFYEVNGKDFNPKPVAHVFSLGLEPLGTVPAPSLEYRLTDAAREPGSDRFWVINSLFLGDLELLPAADPIAEKFGKGRTHARLPMVERLVEMRYDASGVTLADSPPVQLQLATLETRNWEGLALLDERGFLIATDKYPSTILAFVPRP